MATEPQDLLLLRFTPHIPRRVTATAWTPDRQIAFIAAFSRTGVVSHTARSVGMTRAPPIRFAPPSGIAIPIERTYR